MEPKTTDVNKELKKLPKRIKRKVPISVSTIQQKKPLQQHQKYQVMQQHQQHLQQHQQHQQPQQRPLQQQQKLAPLHLHPGEQRRRPQGGQPQQQPRDQGQRKQPHAYSGFQSMLLNTSQRCLLRGNGRQSGGLESPYLKAERSLKNVPKDNVNVSHSLASKPTNSMHFAASRMTALQVDKSRELLSNSTVSFDGWMLQRSRASTSKIRSEQVKPTVSPLARNRFYELRDKTPTRDGGPKKQQRKKESITGQPNGAQARGLDLGWNPMKSNIKIQMPMAKPSTPGAVAGAASNTSRKPSNKLESHLNVDGTRSWVSNWRCHKDPKKPTEAGTLRFPDPPGPRRQPQNVSMHKMEDAAPRNRRTNNGENEKIAPLHNLATPVRDLWVSKPEHADYGQTRCVKILPEHHQCAGAERNITPNDVDTKSLASKLEKHSRVLEPGSRSVQCICFRKTRRAYCTVCKATIIGRAFRKCRMHPDVGFLTDHFYCPFCCAEPAALKDI